MGDAPSIMESALAGTRVPVPRSTSLAFQPDRGAAIRREKDEQQLTDISFVTRPLTMDEKNELIDFYREKSSSTFTMCDADSGVELTFAFVAPPQPQETAGGKYRVSILLERFDN